MFRNRDLTDSFLSSVYPFDPSVSSIMSSDGSDFPQSEDPVYLMGKMYSSLHEMSELRQDFTSMIWITYRSGFPSIGGSGPTTDRGWGCMLRCGQMVLANCLIRRHLGREWRWEPPSSESAAVIADALEAHPDIESAHPSSKSSENSRTLSPVYKKILSMFEDRKTSPYSIHQISHMGESEGKPVGTWFGPNTVAQAIKKLSHYDHWNNFNVHVAMDNLVIVNEIKNRNSEWKPLVLFIPLRLGLTDINPIYFRPLKASFQLPSTLGIIGGRPSHALYFVGYVGNEFIFLDPHTTQNVAELSSLSHETDDQFDDSSYHCTYASRMDMSQLDPSISLCFFCETESDFDTWCHSAKNVFVRGEKQPLFELTKDRPDFWSSPVQAAGDACASESGDNDGFANYDMPEIPAYHHRSSAAAAAVPNVPIEIGREAASLNRKIDSEDMDDGFEFLG